MLNRSLSASGAVRSPRDHGKLRSQPAFVALVVLVASQFVIGGGSRDDIVSLLVLRPLNMLILALAAYWCARPAWENSRPLLLVAIATLALTLAHLIPLPPAVWTLLPGREIVVQIFAAAGVPLPWQPISMAQIRTWNAVFFLAGPIAALLLGAALKPADHALLLRAIVLTGLISGVLGLLQAIGPVKGPLYFYRITNFGDGVGLFSNRNHQAVFIVAMFPLLAAHITLWQASADRLTFQRILTASIAIFFVPLILVSGSRIGLLLGPIALALAVWVYAPAQPVGRRQNPATSRALLRNAAIGATIVGVALVSIAAARARSLERLFSSDAANEIRILALPTNLDLTSTFFPIGSGIGSFVEVFRYFEPDDLLSGRYLNHAHNDFLEVAITAGLPGILLLIVVLGMGLVCALRLFRTRYPSDQSTRRADMVMGRAGIAVLFLLAMASATDYPLRVPSLAVLTAIAATWAWRGYTACSPGSKRSWDQQVPGQS